MRILIVHSRYTQRGGEDAVVDAEVAALRERGHHVHLYEVYNAEPSGAREQIASAHASIWSTRQAQALSRVLRAQQPDVAHVHNHAWALSPAIYPAIASAGVPIVCTLHNYRLTCANAYLLRDGAPCETCVGSRASWAGIRHACFRDSRPASAMVAAMQITWRRAALGRVSRWIALTQFARGIHERAGVPARRIVVRPNTVADPWLAADVAGAAGTVDVRHSARPRAAPLLFVGRLEHSKGVDALLDAWGPSGIHGGRLQLVGDGPMLDEVRRRAPTSVEVLGRLPGDEVARRMREARALIVPSTWYEGFPMVVLEAYAAGTPVVASRIGSLAEVVEDGATGWLAAPGSTGSLRARMQDALLEPADAERRGAAARARYEQRYAPSVVYGQLEEIYRDVVDSHAV